MPCLARHFPARSQAEELLLVIDPAEGSATPFACPLGGSGNGGAHQGSSFTSDVV